MSLHRRWENPEYDTTEWDDIQRKMNGLETREQEIDRIELEEREHMSALIEVRRVELRGVRCRGRGQSCVRVQG